MPGSSTVHKRTSDISTFPISCTLKKHARGFYILSGVCRLCGRTFRAAGGKYKGRVNRWHHHAAVQDNIIEHARNHGAVGYTPHRNLDKMRLDWVRSQDEASDVMPDTSRHMPLAATPNTFPIPCFLEKDARGLYTLSGSCCLCGQTFRAVGSMVKGKVQPWNNHARLQHNIVKHARTHGAVGYTPHRDLDRMQLDWDLSPNEASKVSTSRKLKHTSVARTGEASEVPTSRKRKNTTFCVGCATWKWTSEFRCGASTCSTCLKIACAACGKNKKQTQYRTQDVYNFLNKKINARCRTCRRRGTKLGGSKYKTHKGEHRRECRCTKCGVYQAMSAFRRTKRGRVNICRTCELVPCAACADMLPRGSFTNSDIYRYFAGAKHITCLVCKDQQHERRQRLQNLMKKSKRSACMCKHPHAHTRTCPLHAEYAGERPYPGCDVMSRKDSDWLMEQRKKNRYVRATC